MNRLPQRIVCLSAEAADWFWRVGAWEKVVGVTTFFSQPPGAKFIPRVSGFSSAHLEQIEKLNSDLIITFSDVQSDLTSQLIQRGLTVLATNQRTLVEIETTLEMLARVVGRERESGKLLDEFREKLAPVEKNLHRPRVYFEEWNEPFISGIAWISELIERAGGVDVFTQLRTKRAAMERTVSSDQICEANPETILASWCGRPVQISQIKSRPGWNVLSAVRQNHVYEIPGEDILQPGFRLIYGYEKIKQHLQVLPCRAALSH